MIKEIKFLLSFLVISTIIFSCKKQTSVSPTSSPGNPPTDTSLVNLSHLNYLYTPVTFADGTNAAGVYVYANANTPNYDLTPATGEGFSCVDDVSRAALVYLRSSKFSTDTSIQSKTFKLINFLLEMQSSNGYFYNFLFTVNQINTNGTTSINDPEWWSWRALQTLTEASPLVKSIKPELSAKMDNAVNNLITSMKTDIVNFPLTTTTVSGITIPQWLPGGSAADQSATLILGLIPYCNRTGDSTMTAYVKKLCDGIMLMQQPDSTHFPYGAFLSSENTWHAYGNEQAYALLKAGVFFNNSNYTAAALLEINNFYPWILQNGFKTSFVVSNSGYGVQLTSELSYDQIAYGITPMVLAAVEAYKETGQNKYADIAGHLAAWFLGNNNAGQNMYSVSSGICYDGLSSPTSININSGAESTIEALLSMEMVEENPAAKTALNKYKK